MKNLKGLSLFASAGIAEMNLNKCGIKVVVANELIPIRAKTHQYWHPQCKMICGDITDDGIKRQVIEESIKKKVDFILATPPCQGVSLIGKNKTNEEMLNDQRNFLIFHAFDIIDQVNPKIAIIENVDRFLNMKFPFEKGFYNIEYIVRKKYGSKYNINVNVYNAQDYGVPQSRKRLIIVMYSNDYYFNRPNKLPVVTVREAIGELPSLESGEISGIKNHYAREHTQAHILCMKHTPTGHSAFENEVYFPKNKSGKRLKGYSATYKRIDWDKPAPTITMRNDAISSQSNVHPGRLLPDGTYSDARVLTLRELFILSSIDPNLDVPNFVTDIQIRFMIGEAVPPKLLETVCKNIRENRIKGISLFSGAGIAETYFYKSNIDIIGACELLPKRAELHKYLYPKCEMFCGDITNNDVFGKIKELSIKHNCKFLLATPPCQGMSSLGKKDYDNDKRNYLIFYAMDMIDECDFDYILIENVPKFLKLYFPYKRNLHLLIDIFKEKYNEKYNIDSFVLNAKDYGVPQSRPRGFIRLWKKGLHWGKPIPKKEITLRESIGNLPSLESGEDSGIKWHYARNHNDREILAMKHTAEGKSALKNPVYYPKKVNGEAVKGFHNTYKRMKWDEPCPARAMNSGNIGGHNNVHPGRQLSDGTWSDSRVLTLRELFIVSSLPPDWDLPEWCTDNFIRTVIGEAIPPMFSYNIVSRIGKE